MRKPKYDNESVSKIFSSNGCTLLTNYVGGRIPVEYICSCGEVSTIKPYNFFKGSRCEKCRRKKQSLARSWTQKEVEKYFESNKCKLLDIYVKNNVPLKYLCQCGQVAKIDFSSFQKGCRCKNCGIKKHSGPLHPRWNPDRQQVEMNKKFKQKIHNILRNTLESIGKKKNTLSKNLLGYDNKQLMSHIMSHPDWPRVSQFDKWHIDHIFPIIAFIRNKIYDIKIINHLENLRPTTSSDNWSKNSSFDQTKFESWLRKRGWFKINNSFIFVKVEPVGIQTSFLLPKKKIKRISKFLHDFFIKNSLSYTIETTDAFGVWDVDKSKETNVKYVCSLQNDKIGILVSFLLDVAIKIKEKGIYLSVADEAYIIENTEANHG